jgi:hypothetical protein
LNDFLSYQQKQQLGFHLITFNFRSLVEQKAGDDECRNGIESQSKSEGQFVGL